MPPAIRQLEVALWPEFDQPRMLVIYRVRVDPAAPLPVSLSIPVPARLGEPHAVGKRGVGGSLYILPHERQVQGDLATISFSLDSRAAQIEFYDELTQDKTQRSYAHEWPGGPALAALDYEIQNPVGATALTIDPPPAATNPGRGGIKYSYVHLGAKKAGEPGAVRLSYERTAMGLSAEVLQRVNGQPDIGLGAPPDPSPMRLWVWGGGALVVALGVVLLLYSRGRSRRA